MRSIAKNSLPLVDRVLSKSNIYSIRKLPLSAAIRDGGAQSIELLQVKWLYDKDGFYNTLPRYSTFLFRLEEFNTYGDYINSLRQRISIVHEMIRCNFTSSLPVHLSAIPKDDSVTVLDLNDADSCNKFKFIAHPGQTRIQASLFSNKELRNVILYVPKVYKVEVKETKYITKVESYKDLLTIFNPKHNLKVEESGKEPDIEYDFYLPGVENGLKVHHNRVDSPLEILKVTAMKDKSLQNSDVHASRYYLQKTFTHTNKFFSTLFKSKLNVYTTNKQKSEVHQQSINKHDTKLLIGANENNDNSFHRYQEISGGVNRAMDYLNANATADTIEGLTFYLRDGKLLKDEVTEEEIYKINENQKVDRVKSIYPSLEFSKVDENFSFSDAVKENKNKGVCIYHDIENSEYKLDYNYLLFHLPFEYTLSRSKDRSVCIINCEHPYWRTGENYLENVL